MIKLFGTVTIQCQTINPTAGALYLLCDTCTLTRMIGFTKTGRTHGNQTIIAPKSCIVLQLTKNLISYLQNSLNFWIKMVDRKLRRAALLAQFGSFLLLILIDASCIAIFAVPYGWPAKSFIKHVPRKLQLYVAIFSVSLFSGMEFTKIFLQISSNNALSFRKHFCSLWAAV